MLSQKHLFDLPEGVHYLNCAAYGPLLKSTMAAGQEGIAQKARPMGMRPALHFEGVFRVQQLAGQLLNADPDRFAIIPGVSYGLAIVASNLHRLPNLAAKSNVVTIGQEFPNFTYAFERVAATHRLQHLVVNGENHEHRGHAWNRAVLDAITDQTALVAVPHVHWIEGVRFDLAAISARCREVGALFLIDGTQSVGALPLDLSEIPVDALIVAGYKWLLGPYSIGFAYLGEFFDDGIPLEESWMCRQNSDDFTTLTRYQPNYRPKANRYHMGEFSQFINLPMLEDSLRQILEWGVPNIQAYAGSVLNPLLESIVAAGGGYFAEEAYRVGHLAGVKLPTATDTSRLAALLAEHKVYVSNRGSGLRLSANVFNEPADAEAFLYCLKESL